MKLSKSKIANFFVKRCFSQACPKVQSINTEAANRFSSRTHTCGQLRATHVGQRVTLCGWLQFKRLDKFFTLRDSYGVTQILLPEQCGSMVEKLEKMSLESVIKVDGVVAKRPERQTNAEMATGEVEVIASEVNMLNDANPEIPFQIRDFQQQKETLRQKYRYLDLRSSQMQRNLRLRCCVLHKMRRFLVEQLRFVEVETPTLFRRTPGGAQEFPVATHFSGMFYSLTQSPQQFKQMLMVGGVDRYYQIARCYRDEGARPDRQPEFTQLDMELSFSTQDDVMDLTEELLRFAWPTQEDISMLFDAGETVCDVGQATEIVFGRLKYDDVISRFGTDKPDLRFGLEIQDVSNACRNKLGEFSYAIVIPKNFCSSLSKRFLNEVSKDFQKEYSIEMALTLTCGSVSNSASKLLSTDVVDEVCRTVKASDGDTVLLMSSSLHRNNTLEALGKVRKAVAEKLMSSGVELYSPDALCFAWITDFPLFSLGKDGNIKSEHHPFTAVHHQDAHRLFSDPLTVRGQHYDLVLNGYEVGGGSVRIHSWEEQERVLRDILKQDVSELSHLLEALKSGAPPHAGIALGIDRLLSVICGTPSIRDVIAFPKTVEGRCPMSGAPAPLTPQELQYYHLVK